MTISVELERRIAAEEAEIARIKAQADRDVEAAKARLKLLKKAQAKCDAELDALVLELMAAGILPAR